jgi:hypothetical protein
VVAPGAEVELSWKAGANAKSHKLYFATQVEDLPLVDEVTEPAYAKLPRPQMDKTYYWRIDEVQPDGSAIEGDVWSFNTGKLVAWWKFDETSGSGVADSAGSGYDGTAVHGKPVWDPDGKYQGCLNFDETYGFSIPEEVFGSINKAITISVWVKGDKDQPAHSNVILQAGMGERGKPYLVTVQPDWQDGGEVRFKTGRGDRDEVRFNAALDEWAGRWNHYAFVKDADKGFQRIYLNGVLVAEEEGTTAPMAGVGAARIGIAPDRFGDQYIGKLDDLRIYNYALSEQEIAALCPTPKASGAAPAQIAFGPVIERTVKALQEKKDYLIDLDTGKLGSLADGVEVEGNTAVIGWMRENRFDALAESRPKSAGLWGVDMAVIPVASERWEGIPPSELAEELSTAKAVLSAKMDAEGELPETYLFRTGEGGMGVLQILERQIDTRPRHFKIRYKMLQREKAKSPIDLSTPEATIKSFVKAVYDGDLEDAKECISKDGHDYDEFMEMLATESNHPFQAMIKAMDASIPVEITSKDITEDKCKIKWYFTLGRVYYFGETKMKKGMHQKFGSYLELVDDKWLIRDI